MELKKQSKGTGRFKKILGILALLLVISLLVTSYFIGKQVVAGSTQLVTNEKTSKISNKKWIEKKFLPKYTVETFKLTSSFDGHMVPGDFIYPKGQDKNRDTIIMVHGLGGNRYSNYQVAEFFLQNGYNVITYDQRSSNENTAKKTAFGYWEKFDLIDCIDYAKEITNGKDIGVWGRSFGGATAVQAIAYKDTQNKVKWMILDCPVRENIKL